MLVGEASTWVGSDSLPNRAIVHGDWVHVIKAGESDGTRKVEVLEATVLQTGLAGPVEAEATSVPLEQIVALAGVAYRETSRRLLGDAGPHDVVFMMVGGVRSDPQPGNSQQMEQVQDMSEQAQGRSSSSSGGGGSGRDEFGVQASSSMVPGYCAEAATGAAAAAIVSSCSSDHGLSTRAARAQGAAGGIGTSSVGHEGAAAGQRSAHDTQVAGTSSQEGPQPSSLQSGPGPPVAAVTATTAASAAAAVAAAPWPPAVAVTATTAASAAAASDIQSRPPSRQGGSSEISHQQQVEAWWWSVGRCTDDASEQQKQEGRERALQSMLRLAVVEQPDGGVELGVGPPPAAAVVAAAAIVASSEYVDESDLELQRRVAAADAALAARLAGSPEAEADQGGAAGRITSRAAVTTTGSGSSSSLGCGLHESARATASSGRHFYPLMEDCAIGPSADADATERVVDAAANTAAAASPIAAAAVSGPCMASSGESSMAATGPVAVGEVELDFADRLRLRDEAYKAALEADLGRRYGNR